MKNAAYSGVHILKYTWYLRRQMSHLPVQTKLDGFFKLALLRQKQVQTLSSMMNKCIIIFILSFRATSCFSNKDYRLIWINSPPNSD
jgi:hypothetical protein